jgi:DNA modification methylase
LKKARKGMAKNDFYKFLPKRIGKLENLQTDLPRIARDKKLMASIEASVRHIPTKHDLYLRDARKMSFLKRESVHLVVTSPPYWTLKKYPDTAGQLGGVVDYDRFLRELNKVWKQCFRLLVPGGRVVCVVGDVCLSRRKNRGRHTVVPFHSSIQVQCRKIGFDNLAPIIWYKIANAAYEVENGSTFLGKPYEPNAIIKNDIEFILMERKPGGYRRPKVPQRVLSIVSAENHRRWFQQIWTGLTGASTRHHPAPFPLELAERLIRMFSFVGDTVLDPFMGTGTTNVAAAMWGRNSIGFEIEEQYLDMSCNRLEGGTKDLFSKREVNVVQDKRKY